MNAPLAIGLFLVASMELGDEAARGSACVEGFDDVATLPLRGWTIVDNGDTDGEGGWSQGVLSLFDPVTGPPGSYVSASGAFEYESIAVLSRWLITPEVSFGPNASNARSFSFFTRAVPGLANRVQVRVCVEDAGIDCHAPGPDGEDVGGFSSLVLDINPDFLLAGYPSDWTSFVAAPANGLPVVGRGRIAFRYYALSYGSQAGTVVGLDAVTSVGATVCPFTDVVLMTDFE